MYSENGLKCHVNGLASVYYQSTIRCIRCHMGTMVRALGLHDFIVAEHMDVMMSLVLKSNDYTMILNFATTITTAFGPLGPLFIR
jgi:hypothetical protein